DKVTGSMQRAMDETERRRKMQIDFNTQHGITPKSIVKGIADIMEGAYAATGKNKRDRKVAEADANYSISAVDSIKDIAKEINRLEEKMHQHARNLEFEEAAQTRDQLVLLREKSLAS
ncbi:MAG: UvrB/UvrC motif-containing protein, partial [Porticoccaceae bacterium]